jgi:hypothetical protein
MAAILFKWLRRRGAIGAWPDIHRPAIRFHRALATMQVSGRAGLSRPLMDHVHCISAARISASGDAISATTGEIAARRHDLKKISWARRCFIKSGSRRLPPAHDLARRRGCDPRHTNACGFVIVGARHRLSTGRREIVMAKGQMRSNKEKKKPKADKNLKKGAAAPVNPFAAGKTPAGQSPNSKKS